MAFDPDAYLKKSKSAPPSGGFDPDAYLKAASPTAAAVSSAPAATPSAPVEESESVFSGGVIPTAAQAKRRLAWTLEQPLALPEAGLSLASGLFGGAAAGLPQAAASLYEGFRPKYGEGAISAAPEGPAGFGREIAEKVTYQPRTEGGKRLVEAMSYAGVPLQKAAQFIREQEQSATGGTYGSDIAFGILGTLAPRAPGATARGAEAVSPFIRAKAENLVQSAIKPTSKEILSGKAANAIDTMLDKGISFGKGGLDKLKSRIEELNDQIKSAIAKSPARVDLQEVYKPVQAALNKVMLQANPRSSMEAIQNSWDEFKNHPLLQGSPDLSVQLAQQLKTGTYRELGSRAYDVTTPTERAAQTAQKAIARGLKEQVAEKVPEVVAWNKEESKLLDTLSVVEKRILTDANKNPMGLSLLSANPATWAAFMADKSSSFKVLLARVLNATQKQLPGVARVGTMPAVATAGRRDPSEQEPIEARANGGPVNEGQPYLVGERGPEVIVPKSDGQVIPNDRIEAAKQNSRKNLVRRALFDAQETGKVTPEDVIEIASMPNSAANVSRIMRASTPETRNAVRRAHFDSMLAAASDEATGKVKGAQLAHHIKELRSVFPAIYGRDAQSILALANQLAKLDGRFDLAPLRSGGVVSAMRRAATAPAATEQPTP